MGKSLARFKKLRTTATAEFARLLMAGESALLHLPSQHGSSLLQVLSENSLTKEAYGGVFAEIELRLERGLWNPRVRWKVAKKIQSLPARVKAILCLGNLFALIESGEYSKQPLHGRLVIRNEILRLWWFALANPESEERGYSNQQRINSKSETLLRAKEMLKAGLTREAAKKKLIDEFGVTSGTANAVLKKAGFVGKVGRPGI